MRYLFFILFSLLSVTPLAFGQSSDEPVIYLTPQNSNQQIDNFVDNDDTADSPIVIQNVTPAGTPIRARATKSIHHAAAPKAAIQFYGPTTAQDHIWHLAEKLRPNASITVEQMIIALQQANPDAFAQGNINALKSGQKLRVPSALEIQLVDPRLAADIVNKQMKDWKAQTAPTKAPVLPVVAHKVLASSVAATTPAPQACMTSFCGITRAATAAKPAELTQVTAPSITPHYIPLADANAVMTLTEKPKSQPENKAPVITKTKPAAPIYIPLTNATAVLPLPAKPSTVIASAAKKPIAVNENKLPAMTNSTTSASLVAIPMEDLKAEQQIRRDKKLINSLEQQLAEQKQAPKAVAETSSDTGVSMLLPKTKVGWWIATIAVFLVVLLWLPSPRRNKEAKKEDRLEPVVNAVNDSENIDLEDEYDFMNSDEALPAKLDLANAYIAMEDYQSAEQVLQEILIKGNEAERKEARALLKKVSKVK